MSANYKINLYNKEYSKKHLFIMIEDHNEGEEVLNECKALGFSEFALLGISDIDWNADLSPWACDPVFKNGEKFSGKADVFLNKLLNEILPEVLGEAVPEHITPAGYSLAGLFSVYSAYKTDAFDSVISASGSLWYPEFLNFVKENSISKNIKTAYFSLGDREANTKNLIMKTVEDNTREIEQHLKNHNIISVFELNPGGHFVDDTKRLAKGICWTIQNIK